MTSSTRVCPSCHTPLPAEAQFCYRCGHATPTDPGVPPRTAPTGAFEVARVKQVLADRYEVDRVIGEGGMATVYLARDLKHHRPVAVKVMRPELAATLGGERFLREIEIAAHLNHPHILPMYDSGEAQGVLYYVMPHVEGESLAARLRREGELPVPEALRIAREVAEALGYAHKRGIVHRDIKPANILLSEGHALVADFGIARALDAEANAITQTGLAIGTPQYMSPEQATGGREVDGRSDLYALGAVLYEMLTGEPPFTGRTPQAVVARMMTERPRSLVAAREGLAPEVEAVVMKALARSPADRFATAAEMVEALEEVETTSRTPMRGVAAITGASAGAAAAAPASRPARLRSRWAAGGIAAAVLALAAAGWLVTTRSGDEVPAAAVADSTTRVAVLPFQNQGDSTDNYIVDGITDEVRGKLARVRGLAVVGSNSSGRYRASTAPATQIARELGVRYLVLGRVRWAGGPDARRVQVVSELVDGQSGATAWQQSFEAPLTDVFEVQAQIASRVAGALGGQLGAEDTRKLTRSPTVNPAAWDAYRRGLAIPGIDPLAARRRTTYFEQAVALDSAFVEAWGALSLANSSLYYNGGRDPRAAARAREAWQRAQALDRNNPAGYTAEAQYWSTVERDKARADRAIATALELSPNDPEVLLSAGRAEVLAGRYDRGIPSLERARELDPRSRAVLGALQQAYLGAGRLREAVDIIDAAIAASPDDAGTYEFAAMAHVARGDLESARAVVRRAIANGVSPSTLAAYFTGYFELSWVLDEETRAIVPRLTQAAFDDDRAWWGQSLATFYWDAGRRDLARAFADSALAPSLEQVRNAPNDSQSRVLYALMLAYLGRADEAIAEGRRALAVNDESRTFGYGYDQLQFIRILLAAGRTDEALDEIESLLKGRGYVTREWLRVDPLFDSLRKNPRFRRIAGEG